MIITLPLTLVLKKMNAGYKLLKNMTSIDHPLFMDHPKVYGSNRDQLESLLQIVRIFPEDNQLSFELNKCAVLEMKRGRKVNSTGIEPQND